MSSSSSTCGHAQEDGAYVLGALAPEDRAAFERHLPGCAECARSVRELAGLPGLLARLPVEVVDPPTPPPPFPETLLSSLVRRVHQTERRRAWVVRGVVAAAAAVTITAVGVSVLARDQTPDTRAPIASVTAHPRVMRPVGDEPVTGWLSLTEVAWGTRLDISCTYAADSQDYELPGGSTYVMLVHTRDGQVEQVATWRALPGKAMQLTAATEAAQDDIASVEIRTSAGDPVLRLAS